MNYFNVRYKGHNNMDVIELTNNYRKDLKYFEYFDMLNSIDLEIIDDDLSLLTLAKEFYDLMIFNKAEICLLKYIKNNNLDANVYILMVKVLVAQEKFFYALEFAKIIFDRKPNEEISFLLGEIYRSINDIFKSQHFYLLAESYNGKFALKSNIGLFHLFFKNNSFEYAKQIYNKLDKNQFINAYDKVIYERMYFLSDENRFENIKKFEKKFINDIVKIDNNDFTWVFLQIGAMGDVFLTSSLMKSFKSDSIANQGVRKIKVGYFSKHLSIAKMFLDESEIFEIPDNIKLPYADIHSTFDSFTFNKLLLLHPRFLNYYITGEKRYTRFKCDDEKSMNHFVTMLNLSPNTLFEIPLISDDLQKKANQYIIDHDIKVENSIILCPHANSIKPLFITEEFWQKNIDIFIKNGYKVYKNVGPENTQEWNNVENLDIPLEFIVPIFQRIKNVISVRSGICDVILNIGCNMVVLYPDKKFGLTTSPLTGYSTKSNIKEFYLASNFSSTDTVSKIFQFIKGN